MVSAAARSRPPREAGPPHAACEAREDTREPPRECNSARRRRITHTVHAAKAAPLAIRTRVASREKRHRRQQKFLWPNNNLTRPDERHWAWNCRVLIAVPSIQSSWPDCPGGRAHSTRMIKSL